MERIEHLDVWRAAHALVLDVCRLTSTLPSEEKFGLISQMHRAAVSIPANIAEGFKRRSRPDKSHFYNIAQGSLEELRYYFILCRDLGHQLDQDHLSAGFESVGGMLTGLVRSLTH